MDSAAAEHFMLGVRARLCGVKKLGMSCDINRICEAQAPASHDPRGPPERLTRAPFTAWT